MLNEHADAFLRATRLGFFSCRVAAAGWSRPVPVWFEWADGTARIFSGAASPKVERLRRDPVAHLLVANQVGESEAWVSMTATVELGPVDPAWLEHLSGRYWDLDKIDLRAQLDEWLARLDKFVLLTLQPTELRRYGL